MEIKRMRDILKANYLVWVADEISSASAEERKGKMSQKLLERVRSPDTGNGRNSRS